MKRMRMFFMAAVLAGAWAARGATFGPAAFPEPPTARLSAEEAARLVREEWAAQRGGTDIALACADELRRVERILQRQGGGARAELDALNSEMPGDALYLKIREMKRRLMFADPQIDFTSLLLTDNPYTHGSEAVHQARHRTENTATPGGRLLVVEGLSPDAPVRKLAPSGVRGAFMRPDLSFDATRVLFCMKPEDGPTYNLYEIGIDGGGLRQITSGLYNDLDPIYTPDGHIVFSTSRCNQYLRCGDSKFRMFVLARCDMDGRNIYFISANNETDYTPVLMPDGRLLFTRWEYIDREVNRVQSLWTMNPDGTAISAYWGNQSYWPDMQVNARPRPGTLQVLCDTPGHHQMYDGALALIDASKGMNYPDGIENLTPSVPWAEVGHGPKDVPHQAMFTAPPCYKAFQTAYPFARDLLLVSARRGTDFVLERDKEPGWFKLFLMDYDGNMELVYAGAYNIFFAQPLQPREAPPVIHSQVKWQGKMKGPGHEPEWGVVYSADVYEGTTIPRGMAKAVRVMEVDPVVFGDCFGNRTTMDQSEPYRKLGAYPTQGWMIPGSPAMSLVYDEGVKRVIGTVPVEADGSVHFAIPPVRPIFFQLLDERGRCLQTMRSITHVMPGEVRGCVGCHETQILPPAQQRDSLAMRRPPSRPAPPAWGDETIGFDRFVQPVLDKHCVTCHSGKEPAGEMDFTKRYEGNSQISWPYVLMVFGKNPKTVDDYPKTSIAGPLFPYYVYPNPDWKVPTRDTVPPPMTAMSYKSRLIAKATSGKHNDVKVTPEEEARLVAWVDAHCPYIGEEEILQRDAPDAAAYLRHPNYAGLTHAPLMKTAPRIHRAFCQDDFDSQDARLPRDADGAILPSVYYVDGGKKRMFRLPQ
ncbi:MAG: hypothetical protein FWG50_00655 [Kiritimatiellaeota bacterium]|nr:hypothetical protein [Kiritimatiellota bacterium]